MAGTMAAMPIRYPAPLRPGDRIGVTSPSSGVTDALWGRFSYAVTCLRERGFEVVVGELNHAPSHVSGPREARAAELMGMLLDPTIRAVVPPWGGETGIDLLDLLDLDAVAAVEPTWCVGFSDTSTWLTPLTLTTGIATIHGQNLMDTPYAVPDGILHWVDVAGTAAGGELRQHSPGRHRTAGWDDYAGNPTVSEMTLEGRGSWARIDPGHEDEPVTLSGRLVGGCVETLSFLAGGAHADVNAFAAQHAPEGLVILLDIAEWGSYDICRALHAMRLRGWFDAANGVLVSRTHAPEPGGFTQHTAVVDALGMLGVPILADVECGHVQPCLALVHGATTTVVHDGGTHTVSQRLD
ncbi:LD-carboxypeptidase [Terrabacter aerolatus]|uniref:LD-carboxypeptidase n=1 Tax=Terrabacter aerolatus TaxID=422442 RepID=A0A512D3F0_9MICO|nr:LD-carboxypeptidase [Terrabacter aerolatus]GEO30995.1 LD-carboxypeptidase [Terrabacter aerolatus]